MAPATNASRLEYSATEQIDLTGTWQMCGKDADTADPVGSGKPRTLPDMSAWQWLQATVPGSIRSGLVEAGVIEDPRLERQRGQIALD